MASHCSLRLKQKAWGNSEIAYCMQAYNLVPRALFPGFGGGAKSQGKAPWGRGWQALSGASRTPRSQTFVQRINFCAKSSAVVICKHTWRSEKLGYLLLELALAELDSKNAGRFFFFRGSIPKWSAQRRSQGLSSSRPSEEDERPWERGCGRPWS